MPSRVRPRLFVDQVSRTLQTCGTFVPDKNQRGSRARRSRIRQEGHRQRGKGHCRQAAAVDHVADCLVLRRTHPARRRARRGQDDARPSVGQPDPQRRPGRSGERRRTELACSGGERRDRSRRSRTRSACAVVRRRRRRRTVRAVRGDRSPSIPAAARSGWRRWRSAPEDSGTRSCRRRAGGSGGRRGCP